MQNEISKPHVSLADEPEHCFRSWMIMLNSRSLLTAIFLYCCLGAGSAYAGNSESCNLTPSDFLSLVQGTDGAAVDAALKSGCDPETKNADGDSAVVLARRQNNSSIVQSLCNAGAKNRICTMDFNASLADPLQKAVEAGDLNTVKALLTQGAPPDGVHSESVLDSKTDKFPLLTAVQSSRWDIADALLHAGARINLYVGDFSAWANTLTSTEYSVFFSNNLAGVEYLASRGGDFLHSPSDESTLDLIFEKRFSSSGPKYLAALLKGSPLPMQKQIVLTSLGHFRSVDSASAHIEWLSPYLHILIDSGVEVAPAEVVGTPDFLQAAINVNDLAAVKQLISKGAQLEARWPEFLNEFVLTYSVRPEFVTPYAAVILGNRDPDLAKALQDAGANINPSLGKLNLLASLVYSGPIPDQDSLANYRYWVTQLTSQGANINDGNPIWQVSQLSTPSSVREIRDGIIRLIAAGAKAENEPGSSETIFGNLSATGAFSGLLVPAPQPNDTSPLINMLIQAHYNFNDVNSDGENALASFVNNGGRKGSDYYFYYDSPPTFILGIIQSIVEKGGGASTTKNACRDPIRSLVLFNMDKLNLLPLRYLLRNGADPNRSSTAVPDPYCLPILHDFLSSNFWTMDSDASFALATVRELLIGGADPNLAIKDLPEYPKLSPMQAIFGNGYAFLDKNIQVSLQMVNLLLEFHADPNLFADGGSPLAAAAHLHVNDYGHDRLSEDNILAVAQTFLQHGADPNAGKTGNLPLTAAANENLLKLADLYCAKGANPHQNSDEPILAATEFAKSNNNDHRMLDLLQSCHKK